MIPHMIYRPLAARSACMMRAARPGFVTCRARPSPSASLGTSAVITEPEPVILAEAGAGPEHLTRMTWFVVDKQEYMSRLRDLGAVYRKHLGRHYPAMALVQVVALVEDRARLEIEATAVVPDAGPAAGEGGR